MGDCYRLLILNLQGNAFSRTGLEKLLPYLKYIQILDVRGMITENGSDVTEEQLEKEEMEIRKLCRDKCKNFNQNDRYLYTKLRRRVKKNAEPAQETREGAHKKRVFRSASTMAKGSFGKKNSKAWEEDEEDELTSEAKAKNEEKNEDLFMAKNKGLLEDLG